MTTTQTCLKLLPPRLDQDVLSELAQHPLLHRRVAALGHSRRWRPVLEVLVVLVVAVLALLHVLPDAAAAEGASWSVVPEESQLT